MHDGQPSRHRVRIAFSAVGVVAALAGAGAVHAAGAAGAAGVAGAAVSIMGFAFNPSTVTINQGDSVTWTTQDLGTQHTITSDAGQFDSGPRATGQTFTRAFPVVGSFGYHCAIHSLMHGTVVVQAAGATPVVHHRSADPESTLAMKTMASLLLMLLIGTTAAVATGPTRVIRR